MLENLKTDTAITQDGDSLGGYLLDTDAYTMAVSMAYLGKSKGGALSMNLTLEGQGGKTLRQTWWLTSSDAKGNKNYYEDAKGTKKYLPGFSAANNFALLAIGKELSAVATEEKTLSLFDYTQKKEVPTKKDVIVELLNASVIVGVERQTVDKTAKNASTGKYEPTGEVKDVNEIVKTFRASDKLSAAEIRAEVTEPVFLGKWVEKFQGVTADKATRKGTTGNKATTGAPIASGETKSLF